MEQKKASPLIYVTIGAVMFAAMLIGFFVLLRETPDDVVAGFFKCGSFEKQLMYLTPESAYAYQEYYTEAASKRFVSLDTFIREYYNRNIPKLEKITGREPISSTEILYITEIKYPDGELDTQKLVLTNLNGIWKIDIKKSREYWD